MKSPLPLTIASAIVLAACGPGGDGPIDGDLKCETGLLTGDLVITEVMADPDGDDQGNEYFEIYNATGTAIDLTGLRLQKASIGGGSVEEHLMTGTVIEAGSYAGLGGVVHEFRPPYIAYGYGTGLGSTGLPNSGGELSIHCGTTEVDKVVYGDATKGRSQGLDGNLVPDHIINDDISNYCDATTEFATDAFGSPGGTNEPCSIVEQTTCLDNGTARDVVQPGVGDLVIAEFMANPATPIDDAVGEWFEVVAKTDFDLNGLVAGKDPADPKINVVDPDCIALTAGDHILFARSDDSVVNGGMADVDYTFSFGLTNSNSTLFVGVGDTVIDTITWTSSSAGASTALDPGSLDATANDDEGNWCDGKADYGSGNLGSPRAANPLCDTSGMCMDGGSMRATVPPIAADVTITEWMANPDVVSDTDAEWFEVHFASAVDLNGLQLGKIVGPPPTVITTLSDAACLSIPADTYVVFGRDADILLNGGLPDTNFFLGNISLVNSSGSIFVAIGDVILSTIDYVGSAAGASTQVDNAGLCCEGTDLYGPPANDNLGTPGGANNVCAVNDTALCP